MTTYSEWQSPDTKPTLVGVYQRDYEYGGWYNPPVYCFWNGEQWMEGTWKLENCPRVNISGYPNLKWRGILDD